tara:strand:+ start:4075 stop:4626 length:552 start_codon:yes stop_codon:yes gene_type:complete
MTDIAHIKNLTRSCKKVYDILKENATVSDENYDSTEQPFFCQNSTTEFDTGYKSLADIPDNLPSNLRNLYLIIGTPDKEVYLDKWTIMTFNKSFQNYINYCNDKQFRVFDVAYLYAGMGHIIVLSCDLNTRQFFLRKDGGSNDWDRLYNYKELLKYKGSKKQFSLDDWFSNFKNYDHWFSSIF